MSREAVAPTHMWRVAIVVVYWILICTGTHLPPSPIVRLAGPVPDWLMHGTIFAGEAIYPSPDKIPETLDPAQFGSAAKLDSMFK